MLFIRMVLALTLASSTGSVGWSSTFDRLPLFGDGNQSCPIDSGRSVFTTGDTTLRGGGEAPHSTLTVAKRDGSTAHVVRPAYRGVASPYQAVPDLPGSGFHWLGGCFFAASRLYVLAPYATPAGEVIRTDLLVYRVPAGSDPVYEGGHLLPQNWSAGLWYDQPTGMVYWFGSKVTDGWTGNDVYVARTTLAQVKNAASWQYRGATTWSHAVAPVAVLTSARDGGVEGAFSVWRDTTGWHITSKYGGSWGSGPAGPGVFSRWTSPALGQPWLRRDLGPAPAEAYLVADHHEVRQGLLTYNVAGKPPTWVQLG
jgi:hypothetical protein